MVIGNTGEMHYANTVYQQLEQIVKLDCFEMSTEVILSPRAKNREGNGETLRFAQSDTLTLVIERPCVNI